MSSFGQPFSWGSPILTMAPQPISSMHHYPLPHPHQHPHHHQFSSSPAVQLARGRKRSRDEASVNLDSSSALGPEIAMKPVKPSQSCYDLPQQYIASSGPSHVSSPQPQDRPALRSHKSQRLDQNALRHNGRSSSSVAPPSSSSGPEVSSRQPVVDDFTIHLGIGWRRISEDSDIQAAARGWARFIENNYPISSAKICLESKGLQSYLVEATEGYFLFAENLRHGRLVSRTVEGALRNLKTSPPAFEGEGEMVAGEASPLAASTSASTPAAASTATTNAATTSASAPAQGASDIDMGI